MVTICIWKAVYMRELVLLFLTGIWYPLIELVEFPPVIVLMFPSL